MQVNENDIYMISGKNSPNGSASVTATYRLSLKTHRMYQCADVGLARSAAGVCSLGEYIYFVGGATGEQYNLKWVDRTDRYNMLTDEWETICQMPIVPTALNLMPIEKRWILAIGRFCQTDSKVKTCLLLDTFHI